MPITYGGVFHPEDEKSETIKNGHECARRSASMNVLVSLDGLSLFGDADASRLVGMLCVFNARSGRRARF